MFVCRRMNGSVRRSSRVTWCVESNATGLRHLSIHRAHFIELALVALRPPTDDVAARWTSIESTVSNRKKKGARKFFCVWSNRTAIVDKHCSTAPRPCPAFYTHNALTRNCLVPLYTVMLILVLVLVLKDALRTIFEVLVLVFVLVV